MGEAEALDREHARGLGERLNDHHPGHDRTPRKVTLKEELVHRHRLHGDDPLVEHHLLDTVDEEHRVAVRQGFHHPPDIERKAGNAPRRAAFLIRH